jgi:hypothetical protein
VKYAFRRGSLCLVTALPGAYHQYYIDDEHDKTATAGSFMIHSTSGVHWTGISRPLIPQPT